MRRRPPVTVVAYIGLLAAILLASFIADGAHPVLIVGALVLAAGAAGLYFGIRAAWILVTAVHVMNLLVAVAGAAAWWSVVIAMAQVALLLAPPTRRYFRRERRSAPRGWRTRRRMTLVAAVLAGLVLAPLGIAAFLLPDPVSGDLDLVRSDRPGLRVLFVGNALTSDNSMTTMVGKLAEDDRGAPAVFAVRYARRGSTLEDAVDDGRLRELLDGERWDVVVLQEHSQVISRPGDRTLPAARALDRLSELAGARTVLLSTWGYEDGDTNAGRGDTRQAMQARVTRGYLELASKLSAVRAPVGHAWQEALRRHPALDLYSGDGRRPSSAGSYLQACVLYALLTGRDPTQSRFTAALDHAQARSLQRIARDSLRQVFSRPSS